MSKKQHNSGLDYMQRVVDLRKIAPSPYQLRRHFDAASDGTVRR